MADRPFKVCLLGDGRVGKTSIVLRYIRNAFDDRQTMTVTASCFDKVVPVGGGDSVRVSIWDTAGQERFHALGPLYYRDADGALLVYDITDEPSFTRAKEWVKELRKIVGDDIVLALAGNKADMEGKRHVKKEEAAEFAASIGAVHMMTSAKSGANVNEIFSELMKRVVAKRRAGGGGAGATGAGAGAPAPTRNRLAIVDDDDKSGRAGGGGGGGGGGSGGCCGGR